MANSSTNENKKISNFNNQDFWDLSIKRYRMSKRVRMLVPRNNDNSFDFDKFAKLIGFDRHYVYQVVAMNLYPCEDFIKRLEQLNGKD
ncbi:MAG: hypothetical protein M1365_00945 [Actinobacteria bacterium]|nr:hypothetical protein [Actinomycetota bacterium]